MPSTCIFTKLKGEIIDQNLPILGACRIKFRTTSASMNGLYIVLARTVDIKTDNSVVILNGSKVQEYSSGTSFSLSSGAHFIKPDTINEDVVVTFYDKYAILTIGTAAAVEANGIEMFGDCTFLTSLQQIWTNSGGVLDFDILKDANALTVIYSSNLTQCSGNIGSLSGRSLSTLSISCPNSDATGDIGELTFANTLGSVSLPKAKNITGSLTHFYGFQLTSLNIAKTSISGDLESFLEQWYGLTKTTINMGMPNTVTFHGVPLPLEDYGCNASKSGGVLTLKDVYNVVLATYDGSTWTYV